MPILALHTGHFSNMVLEKGKWKLTPETDFIPRGIDEPDLSFVAEDEIEANYLIHSMHLPGTAWKFKDAETNQHIEEKR